MSTTFFRVEAHTGGGFPYAELRLGHTREQMECAKTINLAQGDMVRVKDEDGDVVGSFVALVDQTVPPPAPACDCFDLDRPEQWVVLFALYRYTDELENKIEVFGKDMDLTTMRRDLSTAKTIIERLKDEIEQGY